MSAWQAIQSLVGVLRRIPAGVVPPDHIGPSRPRAPAGLPAIAVAAHEVRESVSGVGGVVSSRRISETLWSSASGRTTTGRFELEGWAANEAAMTRLADAVFAVLGGPPETMAAAGFVRLTTTSVGPVDGARMAGAGPVVLRLPIGCSFVFEAVVPEETGPGGIIRQVQVAIEDGFDEVMDLP